MKRGIIFIWFIFSAQVMCLGQVPFFHQYSLLGKKTQVEVNKIFQDTRGYMWFGTDKGLFRFDGKEYAHYKLRDSLPDINVTAIGEDSLGRIWLGHKNGMLSVLDHGKISAFLTEEGNAIAPVSDILFDKDGALWFSTLGDALYYFRSNRLYRVDEVNKMPDLYIYDIEEDKDGRILAGTDGGIAICSLMEGVVAHVNVLDSKTGLPDNIIKKIRIHSSDEAYVATDDAGLFVVDLSTGESQSLIDNWTYGSISDFVVGRKEIWIATPLAGLLIYDIHSKQIQKLENIQYAQLSSIKTLFQDIEHNVWLGSKNGIMRTPGTSLETFYPASKKENILAVTVDQDGDTWYATPEGLFLAQSNANEVIIERPLQKTPYAGFTVISLFTDEEGYVWAGLYGEGVLRIDKKGRDLFYLNKELRNGNILNINGKAGEIWLSTLGGASKVTFKNGKPFVETFSTENGASSDFIYQCLIDTQGRVWFATDGKGVDMLDDHGIHHFEKGLPSKVIYGIAESNDGKIWVNVEGYGLRVFNGVDGFSEPNLPIAMISKDIQILASDDAGNIVFMDESGFKIIDIKSNRIVHVSDEAGLGDMIPNLNAFSRDRSGALLFGTSTGIIRYTGGSDFVSSRPLARIDRLQIFDDVKKLDESHKLKYNQNNLTFHYIGLWYKNPQQVFYSYKLDHYDLDWIQTKNTAVTYSKLPPGEYVFRVRVSLSEDFHDFEETTFAFQIDPPFWMTTAFFLFTFFALALIGYGFVKYRERKLHRDNMLLEAKVRRRTIEIQNQNNEIQAQNEEIMAQAEEIKGINENLELLVKERTMELEKKNRALEEYAFINAHKLRSPVASVLGLIHLLSRTDRDADTKEIRKRLEQSATELDDIVRSITKAIEKGEEQSLEASKSESGSTQHSL